MSSVVVPCHPAFLSGLSLSVSKVAAALDSFAGASCPPDHICTDLGTAALCTTRVTAKLSLSGGSIHVKTA